MEKKEKNDISLLKHFDFIIKGARLGTWEWNKKTDVVKYNDIWFELLGYTNKEIIKSDSSLWYELVHPKDKAISEKAFTDHISGKTEYYSCEVRLRHKNGHYIWVHDTGKIITKDKNGNPEVIAGVHMDIDARKKNEILLKKSQDLLNRTNEVALIGSWEVDLVDNTLKWSDVTKSIHEVPKNYKPDINSAINFYKEGDNRLRITSLFEIAIEQHKAYDDIFEITTHKGKAKWVRTIGIPIVESNKCIGIYGIFQDITKERNALNQVKTLLDETKAQNSRLRNFAHIVSHNLHSHSGNMTMLLQLYEKAQTEAKEHIFGLLVRAAKNLDETVVHLSEVVSMNSSTIENVVEIRLAESIQNAIVNLTTKLQNADVIVNVDESICVSAIAAYLDSILLNLISNAVNYKHDARKLKIEITAEIIDDKYIQLHIIDNGLGIDLSIHGDKIFGMYKTFHPEKSSRGIGLFISKNQIETMGGGITVESEPNQGTKFTIKLKQCQTS